MTVLLQGVRWRLFVDTGCRYTLLPPELYKEELVPTKRSLRARGTTGSLYVKGMFRTTVATIKGTTCKSWVYVVAGHRPEPLLGDKDAERLGIITFNPEGRKPTREERSSGVRKVRSSEGRAAAGARGSEGRAAAPGARSSHYAPAAYHRSTPGPMVVPTRFPHLAGQSACGGGTR